MYSDLAQIMSMPLVKVALSRVSQVLVCADDQNIYGVQTALQQREIEDQEYHDVGLDSNIVDYLDKVPVHPNQSSHFMHSLDLIGQRVEPCTKMELSDYDTIARVTVQTDGDRLRSLQFESQTGQQWSFGKTSPEYYEQVHEFEATDDLLGLKGLLVFDPVVSKRQYLAQIGFIVDTCRVEGLLDYEKIFIEGTKENQVGAQATELTAEEVRELDRTAHDNLETFIAVFALILCVSILILLCCIKYGDKVCKKKQRRPADSTRQPNFPVGLEFVETEHNDQVQVDAQVVIDQQIVSARGTSTARKLI